MRNFIHTINAKLIFYDMFFNCFIYAKKTLPDDKNLNSFYGYLTGKYPFRYIIVKQWQVLTEIQIYQILTALILAF